MNNIKDIFSLALKSRNIIGLSGIKSIMDISRSKNITQENINKIIKNINVDNINKLVKSNRINPELIADSLDLNKFQEIAEKAELEPENLEKIKKLADILKLKDNPSVSNIISTLEEPKTFTKTPIEFNQISNIFNERSQETAIKTPFKEFITNVDIPLIKDTNTANDLAEIRKIIRKNEKGEAITTTERDNYNEIMKRLNENDSEDQDKIRSYMNQINSNFDINKNADVVGDDGIKTIIEFKKYASIFRTCLIIMIIICLFIYIIIVILSIFNLFYLIYRIIYSIISLFYNSIITNDETLSYTTKQIIKSSKNNFKYDIFNILTEQQTALSIFNTALYMIYILMGYVILYILIVIYSQIYRYSVVLRGDVSEIDKKYQILTIIGVIFIFSVIHLLIYKFIFKNLAFSNFININTVEKEIDNKIKNIISINNDEDVNNFYNLLIDTSKRNEIDIIFANKVNTINTDPENNLKKYLMMYNIYMYFEENLFMNEIMKEKISKYFGVNNENNENIEDISFIGLLDSNERKLLKLYHEKLPFHNQISAENLGEYQKITEDISTITNTINKQIIKYSGTFFPFLITCIYIFLISIYNIYTFYIILKYILDTEHDNLFMTFIYNFARKYINICDRFYNFIFNK